MDARYLTNNVELVDYLSIVATTLRKGGYSAIAAQAERAALFAAGSTSELLHEAHAALRTAEVEAGHIFSAQQSRELAAVIDQIDAAFQKVGGS